MKNLGSAGPLHAFKDIHFIVFAVDLNEAPANLHIFLAAKAIVDLIELSWIVVTGYFVVKNKSDDLKFLKVNDVKI